MKKFTIAIWIMLALLLICGLVSGCSKSSGGPTSNESSIIQNSYTDTTVTEKLILYFSDKQALHLIPETRDFKLKNATASSKAEAIVNELIAGSTNPSLIITIPRETRLLSIKITDQTAYVDFSEEIRSKHEGGSTGELMTLNSIVNSLTELPEIQKVQILINGAKVDTLVGHADLTQPLVRDETVIKK